MIGSTKTVASKNIGYLASLETGDKVQSTMFFMVAQPYSCVHVKMQTANQLVLVVYSSGLKSHHRFKTLCMIVKLMVDKLDNDLAYELYTLKMSLVIESDF